MKKRIEPEWKRYESEVVPTTAGPVQHTECKRAFYAGAWSVMRHLLSLSETDISEDEGANIIEEMRKEIMAYKEAEAKKG